MTMKRKKTRYPGVYVLPDGRYQILATVQDPRTGKRMYRERTLPEGLEVEDAVVARRQLRAEMLDETPEARKELSVTDYAVQWLERVSARTRLSTAKWRARVLEHHILPELGDIPLAELHRKDVERFAHYAETARKSNGKIYAAETVAGWWRILCQMVRDAQADGHLDQDPLQRVRPPSQKTSPRRETRTLTPEELAALLAAVREVAPHRYAEVAVLVHTGMRIGELYALRWEDLDGDIITVARSHSAGQVNRTKTGDPREVAVPRHVVTAIHEHRKRLIREQHVGLSSGLMFPSRTGGHRPRTSLRKAFRNAREHAGINKKIGPQVLRRTYNTLLTLTLGVDRLVVRSQIGHTTEEMTERYAFADVAQKRAAAEAFGKLTGGEE